MQEDAIGVQEGWKPLKNAEKESVEEIDKFFKEAPENPPVGPSGQKTLAELIRSLKKN
jgi:hypothetical protein